MQNRHFQQAVLLSKQLATSPSASTTTLTTCRDSPPYLRHCPVCSNTAKACVRTLPIWPSVASALWGWPRAISAATSRPSSPNKEHLIGADASHAWFSVYLPNHGWIDFDPTNNLLPDDRHITAAWGRDFADVTPLKGVVLGGGQHTLTVSVTVEA